MRLHVVGMCDARLFTYSALHTAKKSKVYPINRRNHFKFKISLNNNYNLN